MTRVLHIIGVVQYLLWTSNFRGILKQYCSLSSGIGALFVPFVLLFLWPIMWDVQWGAGQLYYWSFPSNALCIPTAHNFTCDLCMHIKSKASLRLWLFCMMKYMHQYKQKRWKYFGFVPKINFFLCPFLNLLRSHSNHCPDSAIQ